MTTLLNKLTCFLLGHSDIVYWDISGKKHYGWERFKVWDGNVLTYWARGYCDRCSKKEEVLKERKSKEVREIGRRTNNSV